MYVILCNYLMHDVSLYYYIELHLEIKIQLFIE